ncbi:hypothetical protein [Dyadobacter sp. LHD-138]|uniref:hypothetical protein n=1 Tax=Dyadobacter sp. LHD-138 TaxID=3071413 RepID=UPI0027E1895A|nr:hypothetical protein [Dyadobacter sp. LHD-138]MDQ6482336.1 hypothetical protein [Dyadobacter sp. LHD-138]
MEEDFDYKAAEHREQQVLLDKGLEFTADGKTYTIGQPYLGTLDSLAEEFLKLDMNSDLLDSTDVIGVFGEQKRMIKPNARRCARIVAISVLNSFWKIKLLTWYYTFKFYWTVKPDDLMKLTNIILRASNLQDFTNSIALMSVNRTTAPQAIED